MEWNRRHDRRKKQSASDRRFKKRRGIFVTFLVVFLLLLFGLFLFGFKVWRSVSSSVWDGKSQLTIVIHSSPTILASFRPPEDSLSFLTIPDGTFIEAISGYGPYKIESVYRLGSLDGRGGSLLMGSLQEYFGIPINGWLEASRNFSPEKELNEDNLKNMLSSTLFDSLKYHRATNLTPWDIVRMWWAVRDVRHSRIKVVDAGQTAASQPVTLPDGQAASQIDPLRLESIFQQLFVDGELTKEDLAIGVLNGTQHLGLASKAAGLIKNAGGRVVLVGEDEPFEGNCLIKSTKKNQNSYTLKKLSLIFNCEKSEILSAGQRADLFFIVGEGYWKKLNGGDSL